VNIWEHDESQPYIYWLDSDLSEDPGKILMALEVLIRKAQLADADTPDDNEPTTFYGFANGVTIEVNQYSGARATFNAYKTANEMPYLTLVDISLQITRLDGAPFTEGALAIHPKRHGDRCNCDLCSTLHRIESRS
jgi:hypothetical protein